MRKIVLIVLGGIILVGGAIFILFFQPSANDGSTLTSTNPKGTNLSNPTTPSDNSTSNTTKSSNQTSYPDVNNDIVQTKTDPTLGKYLADSDGLALYTSSADEDDLSNCDETCLTAWPAFTTDSVPDNLPNNISIIIRSDDGTTQYTYKSKPLYHFTSDGSNEVSGDGIDTFHVARP